MEIMILPLIGIAGLYMIKKQKNIETYENLPNTDIPDVNYPSNQESETTSSLSTQNKYDGKNTYTDKYFREPLNDNLSSEKYVSLTGQPVDMSYFRHNNMAPFFGSKSHSNNHSNSTESQLDHQTGAGSQYISKKEQSPMFSPGQNNDWTHGMPSTSDFVQSRVNPSNKMTSIKPFEPIQVGPGLGLGANENVSNSGLNNGMMARDKWIDKSVDDLRVVSKQKASGLGLYGYEGPAKSSITQRGDIGIVENNRVNKTFEMGQERLLTTTGVEKGHTLRPMQIERNLNRAETSTDYIGAAGVSNYSQQMEGTKYRPSTNVELGALPILPAYAAGKSGAYDGDYGIKSSKVYNNNRSTPNENQNYYGGLGGTFGSIFSPILDILRPSRRENTIGNMRPYQNAKTPISNSYIYNSNDKPETTNREITENSKYHMNMTASKQGGYQNSDVVMPHTVKETISNNDYVGNAQSAYSKPRTYDAEYSQQCNNLKSSVIDGRLVQGNMKLMNSNINMTMKAKEDIMRNVRPGNKTMSSQIPDSNSMGIVQGNSFGLENSLERSDGSVLEQLRDNPYNINMYS
jgi:hypothetical protein